MPKTHTKINQLAGETLKGFAYANNTDKELVDDVQAIRDEVTHHTEIIRDYDSTTTSLSFTGSGINNLSISTINVQTPTTITIDSQDNYSGLYFNGIGLNDVSVNYAAYSGNRPISFTFGINAANDETSTGNGGFSGTPTNGETFTTGSGATFEFISYDSGTDTIYAYNVSTSPAPAPTDVFTGLQSGASITLVNTFTPGTNEVGAWSDSIGNNGVWSIQPTVAYTIGVSTDTIDITFPGVGHSNGDLWNIFFAEGSIVYDVQSQSGSLIVGETLNGSLGSTAVFGYQFGSGQVALTQITGNPALGTGSETFTGSVSGNTINLDNPITYTDTYSGTDGVTTTQYNIVQSETNHDIFGNFFSFGSEIGHNVGDQWQLTFPTVNIETGFETQQIIFPGVPFPLEGSNIYSEDTIGKSAIGSFDLTPFSGDNKTAGIVSLYTDGSQSTYTQTKNTATLNIFDSTTNKSIGVTNSGDEYRIDGFDGTNVFRLVLNGSSFRYLINNNVQRFPTVIGTSGQALFTDGTGQMYWDTINVSPTTTNGIQIIGQDIGLGGQLTQDTTILTSNQFFGYSIEFSGTDGGGNKTGICTYPITINNLSGYSGAFADVAYYNKAGVYSTGLNQYNAVLGFYDGTGGINNASYTIHEHNMNTAEAIKDTKLVNSNDNWSSYRELITNNGMTVSQIETLENSNPSSPSNKRKIEELKNLDGSTNIKQLTIEDNNSARKINDFYDIDSLLSKQTAIFDGVTWSTVRHKMDSFQIDIYPNTRDDSSVTNPENFIYTNINGDLQSTQLGKGTYNLAAYADDATASIGGVLPGQLYQTDGTGAAPLNVAGIVMIKQ